MSQQIQICVSPSSITLEDLGNCLHFGQTLCPFCGEVNIVGGPKSFTEPGLLFEHKRCQHSQGVIDGGDQTTILFRGNNQ